MPSMIITVERTAMTVKIDGREVEVEKLGVRLPFGRKPTDLTDLAATGEEAVYVTETREVSADEFDEFARHLYKSRDWLEGKGGYWEDGRLCVEVHASGRPYLYVDPSGSNYGRYVARLG
jgi:hypothetical protein